MKAPSTTLLRRFEAFALPELVKFDGWLHDLMTRKYLEREQKPMPAAVEERAAPGGGCYRLEFVKCGKPDCHCINGQGHGPYWYLYRKVKGRTVSKYVGKKLR